MRRKSDIEQEGFGTNDSIDDAITLVRGQITGQHIGWYVEQAGDLSLVWGAGRIEVCHV